MSVRTFSGWTFGVALLSTCVWKTEFISVYTENKRYQEAPQRLRHQTDWFQLQPDLRPMLFRGDQTCAMSYLTVLPRGMECVVFSIDGSFAASVSIMGSDPKVRPGAVDVVR